jgi:hypothetical protein
MGQVSIFNIRARYDLLNMEKKGEKENIEIF